MGVGLQPLEFTECLADSPAFRENLQRHEKELDRTSQQIKRLIKEVKDVVQAAKRLGAAQLALASSMEQFEFACIGASMTEDERVISHSLHHFAHLIRCIEDERERMLGRAHEQIIQPLEKFRKEHIGAVKEGKKKFDKKTAKFCQSQERTLSLSTKKQENVFQEADAAMDMAERDFCRASLEYVFQLQAVQERKKFELVETLLGFVFGWWTFHHTAHDVHADAEPRVRDLQLRIQRNKEEESEEGGVSRAGYVFVLERKAFGSAWAKHYCVYRRDSRLLTLVPYNQINVKAAGCAESVCVCGARPSGDASVDRRFCWEAVPAESARAALTLQALSERDRSAWLRALAAAPPAPARGAAPAAEPGLLDDAGFHFVTALVAEIERRGLDEQGLYRVAGVASKVARLEAAAREPRRLPPALADPLQWETKTLTSALKGYLRALPEPLLTRRLHRQFIAAAKCERRSERLAAVAALVLQLPSRNQDMLHIVLAHLRKVAANSDKNLMTPSNLAVCFGPTLLRAERETVASILELKFYNVLVETLLDDWQPQHNGDRTSPTSIPMSARNDMINCERLSVSDGLGGGLQLPGGIPGGGSGAPGALGVRYAAPHHALLQHFSPATAAALRPGATRSSSSSAESVSSHSASPPPPTHAPAAAAPARPTPPAHSPHSSLTALALPHHRHTRVRTLYACLGESEGELSFEPNQIITNVAPSAEPGWLRGTLNGKAGLVPENYVEPLP
ncbi:rho GTPase-activating protein 26 isoform X2 [Plodia interpunctella]|uniref:rho GTPase-activating protein 26 isoform X2 n=1 Tax=Plodia interpunctella TaxID=58824 RepID=UPI002368D1B7|nr:rho GTPase-activating protein 26 isoform X2 [Plodia interpunctella]